jgi:uncharacterized protein (TIGR00375 family)
VVYYGDFHIHSRFSRATSKNLTLPVLDEFARKKGVNVLGTGDFTHPLWFAEVKDQLEPAPEGGLFTLKSSQDDKATRFILSVEISSIYSQGGKGRRVHTLVMLPSFEAADLFNQRLGAQGAKLSSDGRPIVGLSVQQIAHLAFEAHPDAIVIPAHAWTPWFGILGSMSGFDSLEEAFGDLTPKIIAIETGLSSDPAMNWRLSKLDNVALISSSDAHSPAKIAREAAIFEGELSYSAIGKALATSAPARVKTQLSPAKLSGTIEFFPEEGKYHYDGHSVHKVRWTPAETKANKGLCPVCSRRVTVGVLSRVEELADRPPDFKPQNAAIFHSLVPLEEIIAEALGVKSTTTRTSAFYEALLQKFGNELAVLIDAPTAEIASASSQVIAEGVKRVRDGNLHIEPGYDGEYGTIHVFTDEERQAFSDTGQTALF